jgi:large subunit ribosomal protein L24e
MKRVAEIKARRERVFYKQRMAAAKKEDNFEQQQLLREVERNIELVQAPDVRAKVLEHINAAQENSAETTRRAEEQGVDMEL